MRPIVQEGCSRPVVVALYLRDALGVVDPSGLPRLLGTGLAPVTAAADPLVGWAWTRLWASVVEPESRLAEWPLDGPPAFDAAVKKHLDDARAFAEVAHDEQAIRAMERGEADPSQADLAERLVSERAASTGRSADVRLRIEVLPLTARGLWWIAPEAIAVDELLRDDAEQYRAALEPIVERLTAAG